MRRMASGLEQIVEIELSSKEEVALRKSAEAVKSVMDTVSL